MSQYSLSTTDPLRKGSREQARRIRLPWKQDNGVRRKRLYDVGASSVIFDAGTVDTRRSSQASFRTFWSRKPTQGFGAGTDARTPTQDQFSAAAAVLGGTIFESPPVSRASTADFDAVEVRDKGGDVAGEGRASWDLSPQTPALAKIQRGWKISSSLSASAWWAPSPKGPADVEDETQQSMTPTTPSALTRVFGIFSRR